MGKIWVEAHPALEDGRTAFWEIDPAHPKNKANNGSGEQGPGEIYIVAGSPNAPFRVEQTPYVNEAIAQQRIVQASRSRTRGEPEPDDGSGEDSEE